MLSYNCNGQNQTDPECLKAVSECVICSSRFDSNCAALSQSASASVCTNIGENQACFTHVKNGTVTRGCLLDGPMFKSDCQNSEICELCKGDSCNRKPVETKTCYKCDSTDDLNCRENVNSSMSGTCAMSVQNSGCYRYDIGGKSTKQHRLKVVRRESAQYRFI